MKKKNKTQKKGEEEGFYCPGCGGCGYIGCCGVREFLNNHVVGKTDCTVEQLFVNEIIEMYDQHYANMLEDIIKPAKKTK